MKELYVPKEVVIRHVLQETEDSFIFRLPFDKGYMPGQFMQVSLPLIGEVPISICSYRDDALELLIRNVGSVTSKLCRLRAHDKLYLRGPFGNYYPMEKLTGNSLILIGGGSGVAPLRSIVEYVCKNRRDYKEVFIFFGFRSPYDILFRKELERWKRNFKTRVTVDKPDEKWQGDVGVVTRLVESSGLDNRDKAVMICGPPIMVKFVGESLARMGFNNDQIFVSLERHMKCGVGKCGHCMIGDKLVCKDGPIFQYSEALKLRDQ
ncbi:anaerobic sulfite reductase subunit AsrB [Candidatus Woesearchaeota archaeon CG08_land_8_20_14_0_20_47_9]|nr:MAG: hypothetical protein AUJ69_01540 [Candidatus Woesearchaeota archaeon CG1_02_47_18]PIO04464.1 MAG: anaerobic sulfite reductase subunit AsrB [Candidatus Woesearchaeota archaeon CG08_land_8_20_14_0_20_47_9]HII30332.1 anaerobic sulfite reductase subunit AsrB [Candidatus Woesearchaeota archaeon]